MQNLKKTIAKVGYALQGVDGEGKITYGPVKWFVSTEAGGREYSAEPSGELTEVYADGQCVYSAEDNNGYTVKLILLSVIDNIDKDWLGNIIDANGVAEYATATEKPKFALIVVEETTNGIGQTTIYYNSQVSKRPTAAGKTSEGGKFEAQFAEFEIAARPREDKLVRYTMKGMELVSTVPEPESATLGTLTVTSTAGAETGTTDIIVAPSLTSGNSYRYKEAAVVSAPLAMQDLSGWIAWNGISEITATSGNIICIAEVDSMNRAIKAGTATVTVEV